MTNSKLKNMVNEFPHQVLKYINENKSKTFTDVWNHFKVNKSIVGDAMCFLSEINLLEPKTKYDWYCYKYVVTERGVNVLNEMENDEIREMENIRNTVRFRLGSVFEMKSPIKEGLIVDCPYKNTIT